MDVNNVGTQKKLDDTCQDTNVETKPEGFELKFLKNLDQGTRDRDSSIFSEDGQLFVKVSSGSSAGSLLKIYDTQNPAHIQELKIDRSVDYIALSPDKTRLFVWGRGQLAGINPSPFGPGLDQFNMDLSVWDIKTKTKINTIKKYDISKLPQVSFRHNGKMVAQRISNDSIDVWDLEHGLLKQQLKDIDQLHSIDYISASGSRLVVNNGTKKGVYDINSKDQIASITCGGHGKAVLSPDDHFLFCYDENNNICMWDIASQSKVKEFVFAKRFHSNMAISPNGLYLAIIGDEEIFVWAVKSGSIIKKLLKEKSNPEALVFFTTDGRLFITQTFQTQIYGIQAN